MTYSEKLKDPRWQRKRLEIMQRDSFSCIQCGATKKTLNVHHCYYTSGADPWEYPSYAFRTLCEDCHKLTERISRDVSMVFTLFPQNPVQSFVLRLGNLSFKYNPRLLLEALSHLLEDPERTAALIRDQEEIQRKAQERFKELLTKANEPQNPPVVLV